MTRRSLGDRPVLVTGAGFSASAGIPLQRAVLPLVLLRPTTLDPKSGPLYETAQRQIMRFLNATFFGRGKTDMIWPEDQVRLENITLEDLYTIIDKAIVRRDWLPGHTRQDSAEVRKALDFCVTAYLQQCELQYSGPAYRDLAHRLRSAFETRWTTVTLNWDTVWDRALEELLIADGEAPDYLFEPSYVTEEGYPTSHCTRPSLKLLKLHGSFNWLGCPRCHTLHIASMTPGTVGLAGLPCPRCVNKNAAGPLLEPMIVTPTLLKSYDNPTLARIWDEAIHVFGQATDVILVGYSFPLADHDFRYLLRKAVASLSRVWVVLHDTDNPRRWPEHVGVLLPEARYRGFFGLGDDAFFYGGWEAFFQSVLRA